MAKLLLAILALALLMGIVTCYREEDIEPEWFGVRKLRVGAEVSVEKIIIN